MSFLIALAAKIGVSARFQKLAAWALAALGIVVMIVGIVAAWQAIVKHHNNTIVTTHDAAINAAAAMAQAKADRVAGANDSARMANISAEQQALEDARNEAMRHGSDPWDALDNRLR